MMNNTLTRINEIEDYFAVEIKRTKLMNQRLCKYIYSFDCLDKSLIVSSVTTGSICVASFTTVIRTPVGIANTNFSLAFSISIGFVKNC